MLTNAKTAFRKNVWIN